MKRPEAEKFFKKLGPGKTAAAIVASLDKGVKAFGKGDYLEGTSHVLDVLAEAWPHLPEKTREKGMKNLGKLLKKVPKLGGFAGMLPDLEKIGATPGLMKMTAGALRSDGEAIEGGFKDIIEKVSDAGAGDAFQVGAKLLGVLASFLPKKAVAKITAKKVPGASIVVAAWDGLCMAGNIVTGDFGDAAKRGLSAVSGVAATLPGWGTAASVAIDLGLLGGEVVSAALDIRENTKIDGNVFGSKD